MLAGSYRNESSTSVEVICSSVLEKQASNSSNRDVLVMLDIPFHQDSDIANYRSGLEISQRVTDILYFNDLHSKVFLCIF